MFDSLKVFTYKMNLYIENMNHQFNRHELLCQVKEYRSIFLFLCIHKKSCFCLPTMTTGHQIGMCPIMNRQQSISLDIKLKENRSLIKFIFFEWKEKQQAHIKHHESNKKTILKHTTETNIWYIVSITFITQKIFSTIPW